MRVTPTQTSDSVIRVIFDTPLGKTSVDQSTFDPIDIEFPEEVNEDDVTAIQVGVKSNGDITDEAVVLKAATPRPEPTTEETTDGVDETVLETNTEVSEDSESPEDGEEDEVDDGPQDQE